MNGCSSFGIANHIMSAVPMFQEVVPTESPTSWPNREPEGMYSP